MAVPVPALRVRSLTPAPVNGDGEWVLYWMVGARRTRYNFALQRAAFWAAELGRPLLVLEALRCDYPWASDRLHRFILDGMAENRRAFGRAGVTYHPYVEPAVGAGRGLLEALAAGAGVVVTDDSPAFFLPRMVASAAARVPVLVEAVDGNGLLPVRAADRAFPTAHAFRRFLQGALVTHLSELPQPDPLPPKGAGRGAALPEEVLRRWPPADRGLLDGQPGALAALPLDHAVNPSPLRGGGEAARAALATFLSERLEGYAEGRNRIEACAASGLSPYLHFGHLSAHEVAAAVLERENWNPGRLAPKVTGSRQGWWGASASAEAFLDQLVTWRELGLNAAVHLPAYQEFEALPGWARASLLKHAPDPRPHCYTLGELEAAATHDPLWNAAQRQLAREGILHNYLRMLWGKKILEWTGHPREALEVMTELNNRFALDGRDPNSVAGIFWTLGRYDRPWGPERPIFGTVRFMSSRNTARKMDVTGYLRRYGSEGAAHGR
ncbi:MAG: deoxyribodipyrimidine photolyase [Acidobacteriota bacterium]